MSNVDYVENDSKEGDYGEDVSCAADNFLFGICTSGRFRDCSTNSHIGMCTEEIDTYFDPGFNLTRVSRTWEYSVQGKVACRSGQIATGFCASGNDLDCQDETRTGLECTDASINITSLSDCYSKCGTFGADTNCAAGFAITEVCTSPAIANCLDECPETYIGSAYSAVRCCPFGEFVRTSPPTMETLPDTNEPTSTTPPPSIDGVGTNLDMGLVGGAAAVVGVGVALIGFSIFRRFKRRTNETTMFSSKSGGGFFGGFMKGGGGSSANGNSDTIQSYLKSQNDDAFLIKSEALELGPLLNKGGEGKIFKALYMDTPVAVKEIMNSANKLSESFKREFTALKMIQHPHIIRLFGVCVKQSPDTGLDRYLLIMEMAKCSLRDLISGSQASERLSLLRVLELAKQIALGGAFIHAQDMLHLDIKPENILIDQSGNVKLCDLGLAKLCTSTDEETGNRQITMAMAGINGTPSYIAPERVQDFQTSVVGSAGHVSTAADVYSFGIVLWEMVHLRKPHPRDWDGYKIIAEMKIRGYRPEISPAIPPGLAKTIRRCWVADPTLRPTFRDVAKRMSKLKSEMSGGHPNSFTSNAFSRISRLIAPGSKRKSSIFGGGALPMRDQGPVPGLMVPRNDMANSELKKASNPNRRSSFVALNRNGYVDLRLAQRSMQNLEV